MEILKNELKSYLDQFSPAPHFDDYNLISWDKQPEYKFQFNDFEHFDILQYDGQKISKLENLDTELLKKALTDINITLLNSINQKEDTLFVLHTDPKLSSIPLSQIEIYPTQIYDWMGLLEEYTIYIMKCKIQSFPFELFANFSGVILNVSAKLIYKMNGNGFTFYAPTVSVFEDIMKNIESKIKYYQKYLGVSSIRNK